MSPTLHLSRLAILKCSSHSELVFYIFRILYLCIYGQWCKYMNFSRNVKAIATKSCASAQSSLPTCSSHPSFRAIFAGVGTPVPRAHNPRYGGWLLWRGAGISGGFSRLRRGGCFGGRYPTSQGLGRALRVHNPRYGGWLLWRGAGVGAGFSRLINLPNLPTLLNLPKLPKFPNLPTPHNVRFYPENSTQPRTSRTPHTLPHPL